MNNPFSSSFARRAAICAACALAAAGLFAAVDSAQPSAHALALKRDEQAVNRGPLESSSFSGVVKRVAPSIVKITVQINAKHVSMNGADASPFPGMNDPFFRQFFGNRLPVAPDTPETGLGSGVIVSPDGYIVTNNHVVDGAKQVTVTLADGRELQARVVGRDPQTDIAVVKVSAGDLPAITFTSSRKVEVGDRVLAIGNPFGIGETVTTGIVSATGRRAGLGLAYEDFIQTDAAINPGNSGGALVDVEGRLVGINTAILSRSGGFQGVGLAVPADLVGNVVDNLVAHGKVVRGYLGVGIQDLFHRRQPVCPEMVDGEVACQPQQPSQEGDPTLVVFNDSRHQLCEDVLGHILGLVVVADDRAHEAVDVVRIRHVQEPNRFPVSRLGPGDCQASSSLGDRRVVDWGSATEADRLRRSG